MFALFFRVPEGGFAVPLDDIELLMPAYPLLKSSVSAPHFAGTFERDGSDFLVFDLCSALFGRPSRRTFGTRYAVLNEVGNGVRAALEIEGVENVAEFDDAPECDSFDGKCFEHRCIDGGLNVSIVRLGVIFPKGFYDVSK